MKDFIISLLPKKKIFIASVLICALAGGGAGWLVSNFGGNEQSVQLVEYETNMEEYDNVLSELDEGIDAAETQVSILEKYCEQSILMQIDSTNIQTANIQYMFQGSNSAQGVNILAAYINDGALKAELTRSLENIGSEYLDEIITCTTSNPVLPVTVMHYDMDQAVYIRDAIESQMEEQLEKVSEQLDDFSLVKADVSQNITADSSVMNTQNTNLNNLKTYKSSLSDLQKKLVDQRTNREAYIENNRPDTAESENPIVTVAKYFVFGILLGIVIPTVFYALRYYLSDLLKNPEELLASGLAVLGQIPHGGDYNASLEKSCVDIQILAEKNNCSSIALIKFGESELWKDICNYYAEKLARSGLTIVEENNKIANLEEIRELSNIGYCIFLVEKGKTTYKQLEEYRQLCSALQITIWGCVIIG